MRWVDLDVPRCGDVGSWTVPGERAENGDPIAPPLVGDALHTLRRRSRDRDASERYTTAQVRPAILRNRKWRGHVLWRTHEDLRIHDPRRDCGVHFL
jgi:hypothetical protein